MLVLASKNDIEKGELGESLKYILTNGNRYLIDNILNLRENKNLKDLYEINLFLESNNRNLINKLKEFENSNGNLDCIKENIIEGENKNDSSNIFKKKTF